MPALVLTLPLNALLAWRARAGARLRRLQEWLVEDGGRGDRLPRGFLVFLVLFGVGMITISLVGDQGLIAYYRLQQERDALRREVQSLQAEETVLRRRIAALKGDPAYIEHLARKRLGLVRPDEVVIELPAPDGTP